MSDCIIKPIWMYLIGTLNNIKITLTFVAISMSFVAIAWVIYTIFYYLDNTLYDGELDEDEVRYFSKLKSASIKSTIVAIVFVVIATFTPSSSTMCAMLVASYTTPENVEATGELITDTVDYIFEKVDKLLEDDE